MRWFRFYADALDDPKVQRLPGDLFKTWVNLLCLASKAEERGTLPDTDDIAFALRLDAATTAAHLAELRLRGLLDEVGDGLQPHNWAGRQKASDDVTARVQQHRNKAKQSETLQERSGNALDKIRVEKTRVEKTLTPLPPAPPPAPPAPPPAASGTAAAPQATAPSRIVHPVPKAKDRPPPPEELPLWDALAAGIGVSPVTVAERGLYGGAVKQLRALGATGDDVLARCANYRLTWPDMDLTVPALLKHWSRMQHPPPRDKLHGRGQHGPTARNVAALKEAF